jgi:uracil-DNA glycosylase family 4
MDAALHNAYKASLQWYIDQGVDEALLSQPINRLAMRAPRPEPMPVYELPKSGNRSSSVVSAMQPQAFLGTSEAYVDAVQRAKSANTLEELRATIAEFEGIALKKTATNLVFSDGNPKARVMLVGEAPGADEDRLGKPFVGVSGQLLDKILLCINLDRQSEDPATSLYISNILNWRPPGNRTPSPAEIELSLPFIERHIQLIQPKLLILCGGVAAQALLGRTEGVSKLRNKTHDYKPLTNALYIEGNIIPAIATYHPSYLLRTPSQKRAVWSDMLEITQKIALFT